MAVEYLGLSEINGPLVALEGAQNAAYDEVMEMTVAGNLHKIGRITEIYGDRAIIQVPEGTDGMALYNTHVRLADHPMKIEVSEETPRRTFNSIGQPIDELGDIISGVKLDINGKPLNPVAREYSKDYIRTGILATDGLTTLIHGQKLPIFSRNGLPHDQLAAQIMQQAPLGENSDEEFATMPGATGVKYDVADFFHRALEESGVSEHVAMLINLANDLVVERLITPKIILTLAEYLAFEKGMRILAIPTDMTSCAEAMREVSSSKGKVPSKKGFPSYLYSNLASLYGGAGIVVKRPGSVTQAPILTMLNDDVAHPTLDLTDYITRGQVVLDRQPSEQSIYPLINVLPFLSRLMRDGIEGGYTRADHQDVVNQLSSCCAKAGNAKALVSVIGENEPSPIDKRYLEFDKAFEERFVGQAPHENRTTLDTLDIGWKLLGMLPREELDRINAKVLDQYYKPVDTVEE